MLTSVELAPPVRVTTPEGLLKQVREPVLALVRAERFDSKLSCAWVFTHAGLVPGDYPLNDGTTVTIPKSLVGETAQARRGVTLEVTRG